MKHFLYLVSFLTFHAALSADTAKFALPATDPNFRPLEDQFLIFPLTTKDYSNWNSVGTAVFLKDKAVITPGGLKHLKGNIHTTKPIQADYIDAWEAHLDIEMGQEDTTDVGMGGLALYYLRNVEPD